jgi:hypothetical protein
MIKSFTISLVLLSFVLLTGFTSIHNRMYTSISEGLPTKGQWKCNPALGDINGDGFLDLAAIPRKGRGARVWVNQQNLSWKEASEGLLKLDSCGGGVDFGDINNDGSLDLVVGDHCKGIFVYTGDGKGKWTLVSKGLTKKGVDDVALGDSDGDGNLDLFACSSTNKGISMFSGDGKGNWSEVSDSGFPKKGICQELALGDFNRDGIIDLAATMTEKPRVWISVGPGKWKDSSHDLPDLPWGGQYWGAAVGDVNADGHLDLALAKRLPNGPEVYLGDGAGNWRPALKGLSVVQSAWGIVLGDVDGDGHLDLVTSGKKDIEDIGNAYGVFIFRGDGKGNWKFVDNSGLPQEGLFHSWGLALSDLDNDGSLEIGGCFGTGSPAALPAGLLPSGPTSKEDSVNSKNRDMGIGGSVQIWKLHNAK